MSFIGNGVLAVIEDNYFFGGFEGYGIELMVYARCFSAYVTGI